jgi:hypothetical protein
MLMKYIHHGSIESVRLRVCIMAQQLSCYKLLLWAIPRPILIPYLSEPPYWVRIGYNQSEMLINRMFSRSGPAMELVVGPVTVGVAEAKLSMFANTPDTKTDRLHGGPFRLITAAIV